MALAKVASAWIAVLSICLMLSDCSSTVAGKLEPVERGWVDRQVLEQPWHYPFRQRYDTVQVKTPIVDLLKTMADSIDVYVFFGTWCSDSRREVPRFLKVADGAHLRSEQLHLYALDRTKKSSDGVSDAFAITMVPTFVVKKHDRELGRIVESPTLSVEEDILNILVKDRAQ
jgi:hypothetical protein